VSTLVPLRAHRDVGPLALVRVDVEEERGVAVRIPYQMWPCEPSPGADVAGASPVPAKMWAGASSSLARMWKGVSPSPGSSKRNPMWHAYAGGGWRR
jgi:hypothetical protein